MTEEQARKKWCPMVRVIIAPDNVTWQGGAINNRAEYLKDGFGECCCIASDCMMWVTVSDYFENEEGYCGMRSR